MLRLGITGTDTGVGKTVVSAAVLAMLRARGVRAAAMKPVETGVGDGDLDRDAMRLWRAAGAVDDPRDVGPVVLPEPLAPVLAARRAGRAVDIAPLDDAFARLAARASAIVVEGAGGILVHVAPTLTYADLFRRWRLDVLIVAANRLGALNHTLLTVAEARRAGLRVRGVVLNEAAPAAGRADLARETNLAMLREILPDVPITGFPHLPAPDDHAALAAAAEHGGLYHLIDAGAERSPRAGSRTETT
ncbi:MAG TPA: dethiobiotin synthase [Gemmatimonadaceae bacterium]